MKKIVLSVIAVVLLAVPVIAWALVIVLAVIPELFACQLAWLMGALGFAVLFIQFALSSRVRSLESDVGLDRMIHLHRITGIVGTTLIFLHLVSVTIYELLKFGTLSLSWLKFSGIFAFLIILA